MDKVEARNILKNTGYIGNEVGVAFDVAIKSMDKLEKIEQIVKNYDGSIPLDKVKQAREEIDDLYRYYDESYVTGNNDAMFKCDEVFEILDKLIAESEE